MHAEHGTSSWHGTAWEGVALRRTRAGADPDAPLRAIALPAAWNGEEAAAALAALLPGKGPVSLPRAAEAWIGRAVARGRRAGLLGTAEAPRLAAALRGLLLARRGAPGAEVWRGDAGAEPRFVLNLPAFLDDEGDFDAEGFAEACALGVLALDCLGGGRARRLRLGFADLAGLLAALGLPYDSAEARDAGAAIAALARGAAEAESGRLAARCGARETAPPLPPCPPPVAALPGLAEAACSALRAAAAFPGRRHAALLALAPPDAAEALLGAETGGIAPAAGATRPTLAEDGTVREVPTAALLRARRRFPAAAEGLLAPVSPAARAAMAEAVTPFLHAAPPTPAALPAPRAAAVRRHRGSSLHVTVGGHRVALRTAEDETGRLREVAFTLSKEGAAFRSLMDAFAEAVSLGLRQGVPLEAYVDAFAYTRFGPAGAVEGDPAIGRATSVLDWAFRRLALDHLGRRDLPDPSEEDCAPDALGSPAQQAPLLPLDLPPHPAPGREAAGGRRRLLRLVG
ncbi:TSCPD domain-containing protein [Crenalkalicoccus roseus]|uniref:TSCPD domain-containing protein n=1 Tax=Crenalkalicoccus roseus TaxID=1485588 RepID=UPI0010802ED8|nr:TSCPD domain-containing protein [Crenalkalicoccus roseus]